MIGSRSAIPARVGCPTPAVMVRSRIALFLAAVGLLSGTLVGCGSGPEPKDDGEGGEPKMERTSPDDKGGDDKGGDDDGDEDGEES